MGEARDTARWPSSPPTGWRSRRIWSKSKGPDLEQDGHEPYAGHEYASPGPGRPACVWVGELTDERRHPQAGYARQLRRAHQAAVQGERPPVDALRVRPVVICGRVGQRGRDLREVEHRRHAVRWRLAVRTGRALPPVDRYGDAGNSV